MGTNTIFIAELILFDGAAVAWAAWEMWKLRPGKTDKAEAPSAFARVEPETASPEAPGHPEGEHGPDHG
jgi:hypothetical protein